MYEASSSNLIKDKVKPGVVLQAEDSARAYTILRSIDTQNNLFEAREESPGVGKLFFVKVYDCDEVQKF